MAQGLIDYRMQRRAVLRDYVDGLRARPDVCDAHPALLRAATHLGDPAGQDCPVCGDADGLRNVVYAFFRGGPRQQGGKPVASDAIGDLLERHGRLRTYLVEVCTACHWHHVLEARTLDRPVRRGGLVAGRRPQRR